ncbi:hypothetical protein TSUD_205390 [Trifolium subterraneum]|uniref:Uncharacterized protein n=1 Tax=Trifolium subterraneum TaxID=3900 RepID=A0A2Z6P2U5_TRISU|nr:hypothetical protein TSUD_205390 [Trifolium subterraneum]
MLRECQSLLSNLSLQVQFPYRWQWRPDPVAGYSVRGAYQLLTSQDTDTMDVVDNLVCMPSLLIQRVDLERVDLFYNSSGSPAFGLCGRKEIIDCSGLSKQFSSIVGQDRTLLF